MSGHRDPIDRSYLVAILVSHRMFLSLDLQMINLGMEPKDYVSYYELDFAKPVAKYDYVSPNKVVKNV